MLRATSKITKCRFKTVFLALLFAGPALAAPSGGLAAAPPVDAALIDAALPRLDWDVDPHAILEVQGDALVPVGTELDLREMTPAADDWNEIAGAQEARRFEPAPRYGVSYGYANRDFWLRFFVRAQGPVLLEFDSLYESIEVGLFVREDGSWRPLREAPLRAGRLVARTDGLSHRNAVFRLELPPDRTVMVLARTRKASVRRYAVNLYGPEAFLSNERRLQYVFGLYYGMLLALAIYNLSVYAYLRERLYLYYAIYLCAVGATFLCTDRFLEEGLDGWSAYFHQIRAAAMAASVLTGSLFTRHLLGIDARSRPRLNAIWNLIIGGTAAYFALIPFATPLDAFRVLNLITLAFILWSLVSTVVRAREGFTPAVIYFFALLAFLLSILISIFEISGLVRLPRNFLTLNILKVGSVVEILCFSVAVSYRIRLLDLEREQARRRVEQIREGIARELHDSMGHVLMDLYLRLRTLEGVGSLAETARRSFDRLRDMVYLLRQNRDPDRVLRDEFCSTVERLRTLGSLRVDADLAGMDADLEPNRLLHLTRVFQEWISNTLRHSRPNRVSVELKRRGEYLSLRVSDDGIGFDWDGYRSGGRGDDPGSTGVAAGAGGDGLRNIRFRADELQGRVRARRGKTGGTHFVLLFRAH